MKQPHAAVLPDPSAVLTKALVRTVAALELTPIQTGAILGVSRTSLHRLMHADRQIAIGSKEAELAALLVRLYRSLDAVVGGDAELRQRWLRSHNRALNAKPIELIQTVGGIVATVAYLDGARALL
jgi:hypothetical protein